MQPLAPERQSPAFFPVLIFAAIPCLFAWLNIVVPHVLDGFLHSRYGTNVGSPSVRMSQLIEVNAGICLGIIFGFQKPRVERLRVFFVFCMAGVVLAMSHALHGPKYNNWPVYQLVWWAPWHGAVLGAAFGISAGLKRRPLLLGILLCALAEWLGASTLLYLGGQSGGNLAVLSFVWHAPLGLAVLYLWRNQRASFPATANAQPKPG